VSNVDVGAVNAGAAAARAEERKLSKYARLADSFEVIPVGVETLGAWGPLGWGLIREIGRRLIEATGEPRSTTYLVQAINIAIQRGNTACILESLPVDEGLNEVLEL
jgi:hypothetical protein